MDFKQKYTPEQRMEYVKNGVLSSYKAVRAREVIDGLQIGDSITRSDLKRLVGLNNSEAGIILNDLKHKGIVDNLRRGIWTKIAD